MPRLYPGRWTSRGRGLLLGRHDPGAAPDQPPVQTVRQRDGGVHPLRPAGSVPKDAGPQSAPRDCAPENLGRRGVHRMKVVVTTGPSYEPVDDVRRLTNFSTGEL